MLKLVPFNPVWITHDKCDLHGIYRRPRYVRDEYDEEHREYDANGLPTWDITGALPIKQHSKWEAKGFEFITLASRTDLEQAARTGTLREGSVREYAQNAQGGPWHYKKYIDGAQVIADESAKRLKDLVLRLGPEAAEQAMRVSDPTYVLPAALRTLREDLVDEPQAEPVAEARRGPGRPRKVEAVA